MALKGTFSWYNSIQQGGKKAISFTLYCDNLFSSETFDCAIIDSAAQVTPQVRRQISLKAKQSFRFDFDSCGWDWCVGDYFAILGKNDKIEKRWDLNLKIYGRGECPECHGTHKCKYCNGSGTVNNRHIHTISPCTACNGTGVCQTCYVPIRQGSNLANQVYGNVQMPNPALNRQRKIEALRRTISDLQSKIEKEEWNQRMWQLKGMDVSSHTAYSSQLELKHMYEHQLIQAQYELQQLENMNL